MTADRERALAEARRLAVEAHCRYCDHQSPYGSKCRTDIESSAQATADAFLEHEAIGVEWCVSQPGVDSVERVLERTPWLDRAAELRKAKGAA